MVKLSELRTREVINILDGKRLGHIIDIELDIEKGRVIAILLPGQVKGWSIFAKKEELVIPWERIVRIGRDVILVELIRCTNIDDKCDDRFMDDDRY